LGVPRFRLVPELLTPGTGLWSCSTPTCCWGARCSRARIWPPGAGA